MDREGKEHTLSRHRRPRRIRHGPQRRPRSSYPPSSPLWLSSTVSRILPQPHPTAINWWHAGKKRQRKTQLAQAYILAQCVSAGCASVLVSFDHILFCGGGGGGQAAPRWRQENLLFVVQITWWYTAMGYSFLSSFLLLWKRQNEEQSAIQTSYSGQAFSSIADNLRILTREEKIEGGRGGHNEGHISGHHFALGSTLRNSSFYLSWRIHHEELLSSC